jgi:lysophospholipase L1-like esterase
MTLSTAPATPLTRFTEATDPDCRPPYELAALLESAPWQRLVVLGDSVAIGIREPVSGYRDLSFADRVAEALGDGHEVFAYHNFGVRDLRLAEIRDTQLGLALELQPDLAIVVAGGNDALRRSFDPDRIRTGLREIVAPLAQAGALVVTIGLFDLARSGLVSEEYAPAMIERFDALDAITAEVAAEVGGIHVDTHHHPRASDPGIFASDLMHANSRGHAIAATAIVEALAGGAR